MTARANIVKSLSMGISHWLLSLFNFLFLDAGSKKDDRRIHWADGSGQSLAVSDDGPSKLEPEPEPEKTRKSRWSDKKKLDIQHEKELLLQSRQVFRVYQGPSLVVICFSDAWVSTFLSQENSLLGSGQRWWVRRNGDDGVFIIGIAYIVPRENNLT